VRVGGAVEREPMQRQAGGVAHPHGAGGDRRADGGDGVVLRGPHHTHLPR
jgi:hypothetical protein